MIFRGEKMNVYKKLLLIPFLITELFVVANENNKHFGQDIIVEFRAGYFRPTNKVFKDIYKGGAIFGPEVTFGILQGLYGFINVNYFPKKGHSIGLNNTTFLNLLAFGCGLKAMFEVSDLARFYLGIGIEPILMHTKDLSPYVIERRSKLGFGGIAKAGAYINLPSDFILDLFIDYSFAKIPKSHHPETSIGYIEQRSADVSGIIFGGGIGYHFDICA